MKYSLLISGTGGQGVMSAGASLAATAAAFGFSTFVPWYGAAQRGGIAKCTVVISDKPILSPLPGKCMGMIAMSDDACQKGLQELVPDGLVIRNSSRAKSKIRSGGIYLLDVPADDMAKEIGDVRMANMILIGALLGFTKMLPKEMVLAGLTKKLAGKGELVVLANQKALEAGFEWGADKTHLKKLEAKENKNSKYSIEKTTVGEILDTPELRAIVEKMFPQVLNHPLLETGRTFKFIDAVPYMKDMLKPEDLDNFSDALEEIE
ncbi:MAG: 2-oxoacid:acceptor oxidoreductase family protein [Lachnospiraceae bacterium]|nr:2-oxoacid:acceptor oxidoreductase family protein [Lachnospiraceae bacterium]